MKNCLIKVCMALMVVSITACGNSNDSKVEQDNSGSGGDIVSDFEILNQELFGPRCSVCHRPGHFSGVDTSSYEGLIASNIINPGDPEGSLLTRVIASGAMPPRGPRISPNSDIFMLLEEWIQNGARKVD